MRGAERGPDPDRRRLLGAAAGATALACLGPVATRAQGDAGVTSLNGRLSVIAGLGGNVVIWVERGLGLVVDAGAEGRTDELFRLIDDVAANARIESLFNTHWHRDQVGGNAAFGLRGVEIIAHRKTLAHLSIPYFLPDEDRYQSPLPPEAHPTDTFVASGTRQVSAHQIGFGYLLEAHTDGDIYVHFEDDDVIAAGDAISPLRDPMLDWYGGGWLGGRIDSLEHLLAISDANTRFVPSYGPVVNRAYVESEHELMLGLYDILWARVRAGESAEDILVSGALDALPRRFNDPRRLLYDFHKSMWAHYNTLSPDIV